MGLFSSSKSTVNQTTNTQEKAFQDVESLLAGNDFHEETSISFTDAGAFDLVKGVASDNSQLSAGALNLAGNIIEGAANLTLDILDRQAAQSAAAVSAVTGAAQPEAASMERITNVLMVVGAGLAIAMAMKARG